MNWKFGLFLHFNMGTFVGKEWALGNEDPLLFKPDKLDCGQWADAAKAAGMKYAVLTAKHTEGYCLWPSKYTAHGIQSFKNFKDGKGDIVREFVDAFRSRGLKVGLYYCFPRDYTRGKGMPDGATNLFGLPPEAAGDYHGFIKQQMTELLTNYGPIDLLWCDQYVVMLSRKEWFDIKKLIHSLQPNCLVVANNASKLDVSDVFSYEAPIRKEPFPATNNLPAETCDVLNRKGCWFWNEPATSNNTHTAEEVLAKLKFYNERNCNYLLDVGPNPDGLLDPYAVQVLTEVGKKLSPTGEPTNAKESTKQQQASGITPAMLAREAKRKAAMTPPQLAWEQTLEANLGSFYLPIYYKDKDAGHETAWDFVTDDPQLPRVLLIGDSVSRGYTLATRKDLAGKANVHRAPENCGPTANGLKKIDLWLGDGKWDVIHFNFGIHDRNTSIADYTNRLETIIARLEKTGAKLVWASTTPIPDDPKQKQTAASIIDRNQAAAAIMKQHNIPVDDLFAAITPHLGEYQRPNDVHFKDEGYDFLGQQVAKAISEQLPVSK